MNSYRLLLKLSDKLNLKRSDKYAISSNLIIYYTCKSITKAFTKTTNLK